MPKPMDSKSIQRDTILLKKQLDDEAIQFSERLLHGNISPQEKESAIDSFVNGIVPHIATYTRKVLRKHGISPNVLAESAEGSAKKKTRRRKTKPDSD